MFVQSVASELVKSCEVSLKSHWNIRDDFLACELQSMMVQHLIIWYFGIVIFKKEKKTNKQTNKKEMVETCSGVILTLCCQVLCYLKYIPLEMR